MEYGALGFIRKPISIDTLQKSIDDALDRGSTRKENARLRALTPLFELNQRLLAEVELDKIIDLILATVTSETGADSAEIVLWDDEGNRIVKSTDLAAGSDPALRTNDEFISRVSSVMKPLVFSIGKREVFETWDRISLIDSGCTIYLPLINNNRTIGVLSVTKLETNRPFRSSDVDFLFTLCGQGSIAIANARLYKSVEEAHFEVEKLLKRVINNTDEERLRISLELHDGPIQSIIASQFTLHACRKSLDSSMVQTDGILQKIEKSLHQSTRDLRKIINNLHPPDLEKSGLISAIKEHLGIESEDNLQCDLRIKGRVAKLVYSTERALYYIIREAITNAKKHAEASRIDVSVEFNDEYLLVNISDDGKGFESSKEEANSTVEHLGIRGIKERMAILHGKVTFDSKPGEGTSVRFVLPLRDHIQTSAPDEEVGTEE